MTRIPALPILSITIVICTSWSEDAMRRFDVADYDALGDGKTGDGPAIQKAFYAAKKHGGPATVAFEKKRYLLGNNPKAWHYFVMEDFRDLVIEGNGATLVCSDANLCFHFNGGRNITVRGLTLDVTAPRVTQGEVIAVDKSGTMDVKIMEGYPEPPDEAFLEANHYRAWGGGGRHMMVFEKGGSARNTRMKGDHLYIRNITRVSPGVFRFFVHEDYLRIFPDVAVGNWVTYGLNKANLPADVVAAKNRSASIYAQIAADRVENITFEHITIYGSLNGGIRVSDMPGDVILRNVYIVRKPGTRNLLSICSDALHLMNIRGRVVMEDCVVEAPGDDCLNLGAQRENVVAVDAADKRVVTLRSTDNRYHYYTIRKGDRLQFLDTAARKVLGVRIVADVVFDPRRLTHTVTLGRGVSGLVPGTTQVMHLDQNTQSTVIRNNTITPYTRNALLARAQNMTIVGNKLDCSRGGVLGLNLSLASGQDDARLRHVRVTGNTFICPHNLSLVARRPYRDEDGVPDTRNIAITDNVFDTARESGIRVSGVDGLLWRDNQFRKDGKMVDDPARFVSFADCEIAEDDLAGLSDAGHRTVPEITIEEPVQDAAKVFRVPAPSGGDDWPGVNAVLGNALAAGPGAKVLFQMGTYDFSAHKFIDGVWHLNLRDTTDLVIDGGGATLKMHPSNSFVSLYGCERVVVKNFTLNYTMPHHMQGDIVEVGEGYAYLLVKPHRGYPYAADFPAGEKPPKLDPVIFILHPTVNQMKRLQIVGNCHIRTTAEIIPEKRLIRYTIDPGYAKRIKSIEVGDRVATHVYYNGHRANMLVRRSTDCVLENITAYSGAGMNIRPANNEGPIALRKIINKPRPGSNNIVATIRDGIHCRSNRGPMLIEECYFEGLMDDSINIFSVGYACHELTEDGGIRMVSAANGEPYDFFRPGDKAALLDRTSGNYLAVLTVKKAVPQFKDRKAEVNRIFTLYFEEELPQGIICGKPDGRRATEVYNLNACGAGSVVRRNTFMPQRRHALLLSAPNTVFVDNIVDGIHGSAVSGGTQGHFVCGPIPAGTIVRNNRIRNIGFEAIKFFTHGTVGEKLDLGGTPARGFHISDNTIEYKHDDAIKLINVNGAVIQNNTIAAAPDVEPGKKPIKLIRCADVEQSGNKIEAPQP